MKKKIIIGFLALLLVIGISGTFWSTDIAEAATGVWGSCPKGKVNDPYPGDCHLYIDTNNDNICDRSQSNPAATATTSNSGSSIQTIPGAVSTPTITTTITGSATANSTTTTSSYYFLPVALVTLALYCTTWTLSIKKTLKNLTHRKIWNAVLLVTLAGSALLGLVRIFIKDYSMDINLPFNVLFWHVEISIVLGAVGLFHIIWHWRYFIKMLGTDKKTEA
jgi:hypothetical protein